MGNLMVPSVLCSRLSYALMVMISFVMYALEYLAHFMNFKVHKFKAEPLSIKMHLTAKLDTIMAMRSGRT
jgi:hypothetical protein